MSLLIEKQLIPIQHEVRKKKLRVIKFLITKRLIQYDMRLKLTLSALTRPARSSALRATWKRKQTLEFRTRFFTKLVTRVKN